MEIKKGYKQSEVGVIPNDWEAKSIGNEVDLITGFPFQSNQYSKTGIKLLRGSNVKRGETDWKEDITEYWPHVNGELRKYELNSGDVIIPMDGSLVGRSYAQLSLSDLPCLLLQRVARIRSTKIDINYLKHFIGSTNFVKYCDSVKTVTAIPHISPTDIRNFRIPLPRTKSEQSAIATVLSETDSLITNLEKLIAKKEAIKKGITQALLTGKKRLPGFSEKWQTKKMFEIGKPYGGLTGKSKKDFDNGKQPYIPFMNIMSNPIIDTDYFDYVTIGTSENQNKVLKGDLLFNGSSETPEEVGMCSALLKDVPNLYLNSFCFGFRLKKELHANALFLSYFCRSSVGRKLFYSSAQGATRYNLSKNNFLKIEIPFPKPEEQEAISDVINDLENEVLHLKGKAERVRIVKQGMMQNLLTGKIRLV